MPSEYAASLNRRFQDASRAFEDRERRRMLAAAAAGRLETLATELEQLVASDQPPRRSSPGGAACAATPTCCASTRPPIRRPPSGSNAPSRRSRRRSTSSSRCAQAGAGQPAAAAAAVPAGRDARRGEQVTLKAGDRALRDIRSALDQRAPLPSKKDRQEIQARLEQARAALPRVQELRDADEWQRWANLQVQEELCREMEALKAEENLETASRRMRELQARWKRWRWRRARRAKRCGGGSRRRRTRSSPARGAFRRAERRARDQPG